MLSIQHTIADRLGWRLQLFNMSNIEGTIILRNVLFDVCVCMFSFIFVSELTLWSLLEKGFRYYIKSFEMCIAYGSSLIVLRWPCAVDRALESN